MNAESEDPGSESRQADAVVKTSILRSFLTRDWWTVATVAGSVALAVAGLHKVERWSVPIVILGAALLLTGLVKNVKRTTQADLIEKQHADLTKQIGALTEKVSHFRDKRIFLIAADMSEVQWQVRFVRQILFALRQRDYRVDTFVPSGGFDSNQQDGHLATVLKNTSDYEAGVVISMFSETRCSAIEDFARALKLPLVVVDNIEHPEIENTSYVGVKSETTGQLAGAAALDIARFQEVNRILVIAGFEQAQRQSEFERIVKEAIPNCLIDVLRDGEFSRAIARARTLKWVRAALDDEKPYQIIFCTSDLMTLGCLDGLRELNVDPDNSPKVIGHDGELAVLHLLEIGDPHLVRVVVTSPERMAEDVVDRLYLLLGPTHENLPPKWSVPYLLPDKYLPKGKRVMHELDVPR